jgi:antitoxin component of MazEF toxin-antitoxin module
MYTINLRRYIMVKKLIQHGNSAALVIDKPIMEILNITNETTFELSTDGKNLILSPQVENNQEETIIHSLERINKKYGTVLRRLGE